MYELIKRIFDIFSSALAMFILVPIWLLALIGIEISDPGPVFYMGTRIGRRNKPFQMFKFRSMRVDRTADEKNFKADSSRIFPFGAFMRSSKMDELPQLINILKGDMSVVGPRPASADQAEITRGGRYAVISEIKPGLTSPSALYDYIYGDTIEEEEEYEKKVLPTRLDLELYYLKTKSIGYDLKIIFYTGVCIFCRLTGKKPKRMYHELIESARSIRNEEKTKGFGNDPK